ncbi:MAG: hypothetical protein AVDCRST_MAG56-3912, partial [uncultured Cytophagales bacterium]
CSCLSLRPLRSPLRSLRFNSFLCVFSLRLCVKSWSSI